MRNHNDQGSVGIDAGSTQSQPALLTVLIYAVQVEQTTLILKYQHRQLE
jgi:hypothetical protein